MKVFNLTVSALAVLVLTACSTTPDSEQIASKSFDYKAPPVKAHALEVPPDLTSYSSDDRFGIPGEPESVTSYSEFSQGGANRKSSIVLPPVKNVRLERNGNQRWLVVNDTPENVWKVVKAFWLENGLTIKIENPQVGVIETEWAENRAKVPMDGVRKFLGRLFDGLYSSGERDQYHTRLERSKDDKSTEIYISHYGMKEVQDSDGSAYRWIPRPSDPELEATMLQLLMSKLGGGSGLLDKSLKAAAPAGDGVAAPKLNSLANGNKSIILSEPFDKSWRKIGLALEQSRIAVADKDRSKGIYFLKTRKVDANKLDSDQLTGNRVIVREIETGCEVLVTNAAGASDADTQKLVDTLYLSLGKL